MAGDRVGADFFLDDALALAPKLLGCTLGRKFSDGSIGKFTISEVEVYQGVNDLACHASKGKTKRTSVIFQRGGYIYVYLIYGMHWMLNFVTGPEDFPQALLIRGLTTCNGPGRLTKLLKIDGGFNGLYLDTLDSLWIERSKYPVAYQTGPRIGVDYAGEYWSKIPWRFWIPEE